MKGRESEIFYSLNAHSSQGWNKLKARAQSGSPTHVARTRLLESSPAVPGYTVTGRGSQKQDWAWNPGIPSGALTAKPTSQPTMRGLKTK